MIDDEFLKNIEIFEGSLYANVKFNYSLKKKWLIVLIFFNIIRYQLGNNKLERLYLWYFFAILVYLDRFYFTPFLNQSSVRLISINIILTAYTSMNITDIIMQPVPFHTIFMQKINQVTHEWKTEWISNVISILSVICRYFNNLVVLIIITSCNTRTLQNRIYSLFWWVYV